MKSMTVEQIAKYDLVPGDKLQSIDGHTSVFTIKQTPNKKTVFLESSLTDSKYWLFPKMLDYMRKVK
jgi:hypothetical protein